VQDESIFIIMLVTMRAHAMLSNNTATDTMLSLMRTPNYMCHAC